MIAAVEPTKHTDSENTDKKKGLRDFSVKAAGAGTFIADAALMTRGIHAKEYDFLMAGAFGLTAGTVGALWGNPSAEKQLRQLHHKLGHYLRKEGVEIPKNPTTSELTKEGGLLSRIDEFLSSYPTQIMNVCYGLIGGAFIRQGKKFKSNQLITSGSLLIVGALAGLLIEEKKPDPERPPHGALEKTWSWIQEKPLRLTGALFSTNQALLAWDTWNERKANPTSNKYLYKVIAVAGFTFGNIMLMLSSTAHGGSDKKMDPKIIDQLANTSAMVIAAQPKEVQDSLLEHISGYLASQPNMNMKAGEISALLHAKLAEVAKQPPAADTPTDWVSRTTSTTGASLRPSL